MGLLNFGNKPQCYGLEFSEDDDHCLVCRYADECQKRAILRTSQYGTYSVRRTPTTTTAVARRPVRQQVQTVPLNQTVARPHVRLDENIKTPESGELLGELTSSLVSALGYSFGDYFFFRRFRFNPQTATPQVVPVEPIPVADTSVVICAGCGARVSSKSLFCSHCGEELG